MLVWAQEWQVRLILVDETLGRRGLGFAPWRRVVMELIEWPYRTAMLIRAVVEYLLCWS